MASAISEGAEVVRRAITEHLAQRHRSQEWLGAEVARREGRTTKDGKPDPYRQPSAREWINAPEKQAPARIFLIEDALELPRGTLSRPLGYVPADLIPGTSVEEAILADPRLPPDVRHALITTYQRLVEG